MRSFFRKPWPWAGQTDRIGLTHVHYLGELEKTKEILEDLAL